MKNIIKKNLLVFLAVIGISIFTATEAKAVPNPNAINWSGSPTTFVTSLYVGVLGRSPENSAVVSSWASNITSSPTSRKAVFWRFIGSREYRSSSWARQKKEYYVYQRYNARTNRYSYTVSKGPLTASWIVVERRQTFGVAVALRNYYQTYVTSR